MTTFEQLDESVALNFIPPHLPSNILVIPPEKYMEMYNMDVSDYLDFKGGSGGKKFAYLSWSWAWVLLRKYFPTLVPTYLPSPEGDCYWIDRLTLEAYIKPILVDAETGAQSIPFDFPIMDFRNQSVKMVEKITNIKEDGTTFTTMELITNNGKPAIDRMQIEKNMHRAIVKAIAKTTGIGIRLWNDEDVDGDQRAKYLEKLDALFGMYLAHFNKPHEDARKVFQMTNKELIELGKSLKATLDKNVTQPKEKAETNGAKVLYPE